MLGAGASSIKMIGSSELLQNHEDNRQERKKTQDLLKEDYAGAENKRLQTLKAKKLLVQKSSKAKKSWEQKNFKWD